MLIYTGFFIDAFRRWSTNRAVDENATDDHKITVSNHQANGVTGIHQAKVTLQGDPTVYRMLIAPANAPITINGRPIGDHFAEPLGDR